MILSLKFFFFGVCLGGISFFYKDCFFVSGKYVWVFRDYNKSFFNIGVNIGVNIGINIGFVIGVMFLVSYG